MFEDFTLSAKSCIYNVSELPQNPCDALTEYRIGSVYSMFTVYPHLLACLYFVQRQSVAKLAKYTVRPNGSVIGYTISLSVFLFAV